MATKPEGTHGSWRAKRELVPPKHAEGLPEPPAELSAAAKREWYRLIGEMDASILSKADRNELARLCVLWSQYEECQEALADGGLIETHTNVKGHSFTAIRAEATLALKIGEQLVRLASRFGLTPAARASIGIKRADNTTANDKKVARFGLRRLK
ncbi:MAG: phage terminase small subunit P27 family [Candidatus Hydrogenedentota bacterium]